MRLRSVTIKRRTLEKIGPEETLKLLSWATLALGPDYKSEKMLNEDATKFTRGNN